MLGIGDVTCELTKSELAKKSKKIDAGSYPTLFSLYLLIHLLRNGDDVVWI